MKTKILVSLVGIMGVLGHGGCARAKKPVCETLAIAPATSASSVADVVSLVLPSVVTISSVHALRAAPAELPPELRRQFDGQHAVRVHAVGSGVVVGRGLVVTNHHVVDGADEIKVKGTDRREMRALVVGSDPTNDIAVLCMTGDTGALRPITWGDSSRVRLGDTVIAIGDPFGLGETVTVGVVSAKSRTDLGILDHENFIQTDAAMNPGSSGGALINARGELVGINTAILSRTGGYMGIGFAIPSNTAKPITERLAGIAQVVPGWLGVDGSDVTPDMAKVQSVAQASGVMVTRIQRDAPAARAGILRGDVINKVNGEAVDSTGKLENLVASAGANADLRLEISRHGKTMSVVVKLLAEPALPAGHKGGSARKPRC